MKSGYKTTEFWLTLIAQIVPVLVLLGVIGAEQAETLQGTLGDAVKAFFALVAAVLPIWKYIDSRTQVKMANQVAGLTVDAVEELAR